MAELPVGGQAVIEGVMMRSPNCLAVAVRTPKGRLLVRQRRWVSLATRHKFLRWPFFRGILVLGESLHNGISTLNFSALVQEQGLREIEEEKKAGSGQNVAGSGPHSPDHAGGAARMGSGQNAPADGSAPSLWITLAVAIVMALALFAALPHFLTWGLGLLLGSDDLASGTSFLFQVVDGIIKLAIFLGYVWGISFIPDIRRVFMYHGAEHKCIYAFEKGLALTVENAALQTTLHPRCGTSFLLVVLLIAILVFTVVFPFIPPISEIGLLNQAFFVLVKLLLLFPIAGVSYEVIRLAGRKPDHRLLRLLIWPGLATQRITTRNPDSAQIEVAMASLVTVLAAEKTFAEDPSKGAVEGQLEYEDFAAFREERAGT